MRFIVISLLFCSVAFGQVGNPSGAVAILGAVTVDASGNTNIEVRLVNANGADLQVDTVTRTLITTDDYSHHEVHEGSHYTCGETVTLGDTATNYYVVVTADSTKWAHMLWFFSGALDTDINVYEGATNAAGSALTCVNNNRNSTNTAGVVVSNATAPVSGSMIFSLGFGTDTGSGGNRVAAGGSARGDAEFVLKQDETYMIEIISHSAANKTGFLLEWYEHTNLD